MSVEQLKEEVHRKVNEAADERLLIHIIRLLDREIEAQEPGIIYLTEEQKAKVLQGMEDIRNGNVFSQEEVDRELDQFFERQEWKHERD